MSHFKKIKIKDHHHEEHIRGKTFDAFAVPVNAARPEVISYYLIIDPRPEELNCGTMNIYESDVVLVEDVVKVEIQEKIVEVTKAQTIKDIFGTNISHLSIDFYQEKK